MGLDTVGLRDIDVVVTSAGVKLTGSPLAIAEAVNRLGELAEPAMPKLDVGDERLRKEVAETLRRTLMYVPFGGALIDYDGLARDVIWSAKRHQERARGAK